MTAEAAAAEAAAAKAAAAEVVNLQRREQQLQAAASAETDLGFRSSLPLPCDPHLDEPTSQRSVNPWWLNRMCR